MRITKQLVKKIGKYINFVYYSDNLASRLMSCFSRERLLVSVLICSILAVIIFSLVKYVILKDYKLFIMAPCDPSISECFVRECEGDIRCSDQLEMNYKIIIRKASDLLSCEKDIDCSPFSCNSSQDCEIYYCSEHTLEIFSLSDRCSE